MSHSQSHALRLLLEAVVAGVIVGLLVIAYQSLGNRSTQQTGYEKAVHKAVPAVVNIYTKRVEPGPRRTNPFSQYFYEPSPNRIQASLGSGVIVSSDGHVLTSYHVIKDASVILLALADGRETEAHVMGIDAATDLALLRIDLPDLPVLPLNQREPVRVGEVVLAIGNPLGMGQTVSMGIVGATGRSQLGIATFENFIQTDAAINQGNSGGALVDADGRLVGINTAILSSDGQWQGIGFATPASVASKVIHDLTRYGYVVRGYLGVMAQNATPELTRNLQLPVKHSAVITSVEPHSPAALAGIQRGDLLLGINNRAISGGHDAMNQVAGSQPGDTMTFKLWRNGKIFAVEVTIGTRPTNLDQ